MLRMLLALMLLGLIGGTPAAGRPYPVGTGWSRAPDLSVYGALVLSSTLAREQEILCRGRNPAQVQDEWRVTYAAREAWLGDAMRARYGEGPVARATNVKVGRIDCPTIADHKWRRHHDRMLRLLELRLVPTEQWRGAE